jgi:hypothetical protein
VEQFDLAVRRAAYAIWNHIPADELVERDIRIPRRQGVRLTGTEQGSLELLLSLPPWIVGALASQPATALANLIALLSARETIRVQLRRLVLTPAELHLLESHRPEPVDLPTALNDGSSASDRSATALYEEDEHPVVASAAQEALPAELEELVNSAEPLVDVEVGHVRVRSRRPDIDVVVQEGERIISVGIRTPRR